MRSHVAPQFFKLSYSVVAFFLLVANLRPALTSVGPLLEAIRSSLGPSSAAAGLLTTLPLLVFAAASPLASLGEVIGIERTRGLPSTDSGRDRAAVARLGRGAVWRDVDFLDRNRGRQRSGSEPDQTTSRSTSPG
jgi:hypothetical protein